MPRFGWKWILMAGHNRRLFRIYKNDKKQAARALQTKWRISSKNILQGQKVPGVGGRRLEEGRILGRDEYPSWSNWWSMRSIGKTYWKGIWIRIMCIWGCNSAYEPFCGLTGPQRWRQCRWLFRQLGGQTSSLHNSSVFGWKASHSNKKPHLVTLHAKSATFNIHTMPLSLSKLVKMISSGPRPLEKGVQPIDWRLNSSDWYIIEHLRTRLWSLVEKLKNMRENRVCMEHLIAQHSSCMYTQKNGRMYQSEVGSCFFQNANRDVWNDDNLFFVSPASVYQEPEAYVRHRLASSVLKLRKMIHFPKLLLQGALLNYTKSHSALRNKSENLFIGPAVYIYIYIYATLSDVSDMIIRYIRRPLRQRRISPAALLVAGQGELKWGFESIEKRRSAAMPLCYQKCQRSHVGRPERTCCRLGPLVMESWKSHLAGCVILLHPGVCQLTSAFWSIYRARLGASK